MLEDKLLASMYYRTNVNITLQLRHDVTDRSCHGTKDSGDNFWEEEISYNLVKQLSQIKCWEHYWKYSNSNRITLKFLVKCLVRCYQQILYYQISWSLFLFITKCRRMLPTARLRIEKTRITFLNVKNWMISKGVNLLLKLRLLKYYVRSVLPYGMESWILTFTLE